MRPALLTLQTRLLAILEYLVPHESAKDVSVPLVEHVTLFVVVASWWKLVEIDGFDPVFNREVIKMLHQSPPDA